MPPGPPERGGEPAPMLDKFRGKIADRSYI
jgi:hypothetical protein